jgi:hypothetical protein
MIKLRTETNRSDKPPRRTVGSIVNIVGRPEPQESICPAQRLLVRASGYTACTTDTADRIWIMMDESPDPYYYRLGGGDLDRLFEKAYRLWITVPLADLGIPAIVLQSSGQRARLRTKLYSAAHARRYSLRTNFVWDGPRVQRMTIMTLPSQNTRQAPIHVDPSYTDHRLRY